MWMKKEKRQSWLEYSVCMHSKIPIGIVTPHVRARTTIQKSRGVDTIHYSVYKVSVFVFTDLDILKVIC